MYLCMYEVYRQVVELGKAWTGKAISSVRKGEQQRSVRYVGR